MAFDCVSHSRAGVARWFVVSCRVHRCVDPCASAMPLVPDVACCAVLVTYDFYAGDGTGADESYFFAYENSNPSTWVYSSAAVAASTVGYPSGQSSSSGYRFPATTFFLVRRLIYISVCLYCGHISLSYIIHQQLCHALLLCSFLVCSFLISLL